MYENGCKFKLGGGGISRKLCCYKYVKVVLTCVCGFSMYHYVHLLSCRAFLEECIGVSCARVWYVTR